MRQLTLLELIGLPRVALINLETEMIRLMAELPQDSPEYRTAFTNRSLIRLVLASPNRAPRPRGP